MDSGKAGEQDQSTQCAQSTGPKVFNMYLCCVKSRPPFSLPSWHVCSSSPVRPQSYLSSSCFSFFLFHGTLLCFSPSLSSHHSHPRCVSCASPVRMRTILFLLKTAFLERVFKRVYPPPTSTITPHSLLYQPAKNMTLANFLMNIWFQGKCKEDSSWCC